MTENNPKTVGELREEIRHMDDNCPIYLGQFPGPNEKKTFITDLCREISVGPKSLALFTLSVRRN